jgi:RNA polymerase sporulation-specific sigma factor
MGAAPEGVRTDVRLRSDDVRLVRMAQSGDEVAYSEILSRYRGFVRVKSRGYFLVGAEREDVVQEAMIGLFKAIRDYDWERQASFRSFADLCITRQLITAIKTSRRQKHQPLNGYISLSAAASREEGDEREIGDMLAAVGSPDPADVVVSALQTEIVTRGFMDDLSGLERDVLRLYAAGRSYQEIATALHRHVKAVDNALQRVKRKMLVQMRLQDMC